MSGLGVKLNPILDESQKHAALLVASGDLDAFVRRTSEALDELREAKATFVTALAEADRDAAFSSLLSVVSAIGRIRDSAEFVGFPRKEAE